MSVRRAVVGADALDDVALNELVRQQPQRPTRPSLRRLCAGQGNQVGFSLTIELFLTAAHPLNCGTTNVQGVGDVIVLHGAAGLCLIAHEQNAGMGLFVGSDAPAGDQGLEFLLFFQGQFEPFAKLWSRRELLRVRG